MASHPHPGKLDPHARLVAKLREQAVEVQRLASGLNEESLAKRTIPGKWSLKELVCHLWRVQQVFEGRIQAMRAENEPVIAPYDPDTDPEFNALVAGKTAQAWLETFTADRENLAKTLEALSPAEWHRAGRHREYPHYDVQFAVEYLGHHEAHHIYQMFQRRPVNQKPRP